MGMKSPFPLRAILSRGVSIQRAFRASSWDGKEVKTPLDNSGTVADTWIHISERQSQFPAKEPFFPVDWVDVEPGTPRVSLPSVALVMDGQDTPPGKQDPPRFRHGTPGAGTRLLILGFGVRYPTEIQ